jgi:succinate dehydrogenase/fumarate reductase cytochrome b subunit
MADVQAMGLYQKKGFKQLALLILIISAFPVGYFTFHYVDGLGIGSLEITILVNALFFTILMTIAYALIRFMYWTVDGFLQDEE